MITTSNTDTITAAIAYIAAEAEDAGTYRYYDDATQGWWRVTADQLADLGQRLVDGERDAYSAWCADTSAVLA